MSSSTLRKTSVLPPDSDASLVSVGTLENMAQELATSYQHAAPFPHIVIDDFLPTEVIDRLIAEFPGPADVMWHKFSNQNEVKLATKHESQINDYARRLIHELNSGIFIEFLESVTGIKGLVPDPHLKGGGLHQIMRGGKLGVHVDFNYHPTLKLDRRLNLLLYLNDDWHEEYGGHLELWDREMKVCEKKILPIKNRLVVFSTTDFSYHGHPEPLTCPDGRSRKSIALYYYSNGRPQEEKSSSHDTVFRARPGERIAPSALAILRSLIPPIAFQIKNRLKGK